MCVGIRESVGQMNTIALCEESILLLHTDCSDFSLLAAQLGHCEGNGQPFFTKTWLLPTSELLFQRAGQLS